MKVATPFVTNQQPGILLKRGHRDVNTYGRISTMILLAGLCPLAVALNGCATCGGSTADDYDHRDDGGRGSLSSAVDQAADESPPGRGSGATRTKNDHRDQPSDSNHDSDDGGGSFLADFLVGLFFCNDDEGDSYVAIETVAPEPRPAPKPAKDTTAGPPSTYRKRFFSGGPSPSSRVIRLRACRQSR